MRLLLRAVTSGFFTASLKPLFFVGIDPGKAGFFAAVSADGEVLWTAAMPMRVEKKIVKRKKGKGKRIKQVKHYDLPALWLLANRLRGGVVLLERQQAYPGEGAVSNFSTGYGYGLLKAMLTAANVPFEEITSSVWKTQYGVAFERGEPKPEDRNERTKATKARAVARAADVFPGVDLRRTKRSKVPCSDNAEALLIADFNRRTYESRRQQRVVRPA